MSAPTLLSPPPVALRILTALTREPFILAGTLLSSQDAEPDDLAALARYRQIKARLSGTRGRVDLGSHLRAGSPPAGIEVALLPAGRRIATSPEQTFRMAFATRSPHRLAGLAKLADNALDVALRLQADRQIHCRGHATGVTLNAEMLAYFNPELITVYLSDRGRVYLPRRI